MNLDTCEDCKYCVSIDDQPCCEKNDDLYIEDVKDCEDYVWQEPDTRTDAEKRFDESGSYFR